MRDGEEWERLIRLHSVELEDLYIWLIIIVIIQSRTLKWAGRVARMTEEKYV